MTILLLHDKSHRVADSLHSPSKYCHQKAKIGFTMAWHHFPSDSQQCDIIFSSTFQSHLQKQKMKPQILFLKQKRKKSRNINGYPKALGYLPSPQWWVQGSELLPFPDNERTMQMANALIGRYREKQMGNNVQSRPDCASKLSSEKKQRGGYPQKDIARSCFQEAILFSYRWNLTSL